MMKKCNCDWDESNDPVRETTADCIVGGNT